MPSTYAHYKFGKEVYQQLPKDIREQIKGHKNLYAIGLHGPDILFYYHALFSNAVNQVGYHLHDQKAGTFFYPMMSKIQKNEVGHAALAYLYGYLCHFALDSECHGYIEKKIQSSNVPHTEIEVEFDRMLMLQDGMNPISHPLTNHLKYDEADCRVMSQFYPTVTAAQIEKSLDLMKFYNHLLLAPHRWKRIFIYTILKCTGNYKEMHGCMVNLNPNPKCIDSNKILSGLYGSAVEQAVQLITTVYDKLKDNRAEIQDISRFDRTFGVD